MHKFAHRLKGNKTLAMPRHLIFFDSETYTSKTSALGQEQRLKLYTALYWRRGDKDRPEKIVRTHGKTDKELTLFILSRSFPKSRLVVMSANIWFDLRVSALLHQLIRADFKVTSFFAHGKVFLMKLRRGKETIQFINIQNIFAYSVKAIGEMIGLPKLSIDFENVPDDKLLEYCKRDTEIIFEAIRYWFKFVTDNDLGSFGPTFASQAFNAYRHRFMDMHIMIHDNVKVTALEREGYYGGRTECFFIGELKRKKVYALDINSQYPYVMKHNNFPRALRYYTDKATPDSLYRLTSHYCIMANCDLDTDLPVYPKRGKEKTFFPTGRFNTTLSTPSFRFAYEHGHVKKLHSAAVYTHGRIFTKWVDSMYAIRKNYLKAGNSIMGDLTKKLMNSLYGKFGQKSDEVLSEVQLADETYEIERHYSVPDGKWYNIINIGTLQKVVREKVTEAFNSFPAIAAHVTDYARMYLWKLIVSAGTQEVYYVDTDSLYVTYRGYLNLKPHLDKYELGKLKLETSATYFKIYGPKDYIIGKKSVLKGVPQTATQLDKNTYECLLFPGLRRDLQKGMSKYYHIETRIKHLKREYDKGVVGKSGRVTPFSLEEF